MAPQAVRRKHFPASFSDILQVRNVSVCYKHGGIDACVCVRGLDDCSSDTTLDKPTGSSVY